ncbi:restriction endonuclease subunit S [Latilactobacillus curvatus]|uniref:restriction endonuclease subunit S n=1 Tax=Latilactobacillus curvatus TaxID=28038 RepID=UPI002410DF8D|nr:restriction endonuclease subunit S [Latilactobacillus curvatus]MDG2979772.1 restriction endonuclease subunit S [Latilactobacillus curvatus]
MELNSFSDVRDGTHSSPKYIENGYPMVTSKNLSEFGLDMTDISYISADNFNEIKKRSKVDIGDILFGMIGTIGNPIIVNRDDFAIKNVALIKEKKQTKILNTWLLQYFKTPTFNRFIQQETAGGTQKFIALGLIRSMRVLIPSVTEQKEIGEFFQKLDQAITLQQRRLDLLKKLKQGYLQQMFPTKDEVIPQLRFNIFNGDWEQVKLSELVTKEKSYSLSRDVETEKETETRYIHYGDIHTGIADKITNKNQLPFIKEDSYESLLKGDLILADASEDYQGIAKPAIILETSKYRIVAGLHTIVLRSSDKSDSLYLYYLLKTKSFKRHGYRMGTGMKVFGITANNVLAFKTLLPSKKEQYRISQLLKIMDRLLALQQSKIKQLQQLKQAYLQKLFP